MTSKFELCFLIFRHAVSHGNVHVKAKMEKLMKSWWENLPYQTLEIGSGSSKGNNQS